MKCTWCLKKRLIDSLRITSPYTYLWYKEGMHNLININCAHDIDIWTFIHHGMKWKASIFTRIWCHFAPPQNLSISTNMYLQSIYPTTLIQKRSASGRPLIHREGHIFILQRTIFIHSHSFSFIQHHQNQSKSRWEEKKKLIINNNHWKNSIPYCLTRAWRED